jgi:hypothetical protein
MELDCGGRESKALLRRDEDLDEALVVENLNVSLADHVAVN